MQKTALLSIRSFVIYITRISTYHASYYSNIIYNYKIEDRGKKLKLQAHHNKLLIIYFTIIII